MSNPLNLNIFGGLIARAKKVEVLPVSVLEIAPQLGSRREEGSHDNKSSRSEYSYFPYEVASLCYELYLREAKDIFDPFAGWGERHSFAQVFGKNYAGYDCSKESIKKAEETYGVKNTLADSRFECIPSFDGLITCPPYWNLETYSEFGLDAINDWGTFCIEYAHVLSRCYDAAEDGAKFCIMAGDWRANGRYFDLCHQTRLAMKKCGAEIFDEVIVSRLKISKVKVMMPQAVRLGYSVKVHENLMVFRKPITCAANP